jgi:hypothetical protein
MHASLRPTLTAAALTAASTAALAAGGLVELTPGSDRVFGDTTFNIDTPFVFDAQHVLDQLTLNPAATVFTLPLYLELLAERESKIVLEDEDNPGTLKEVGELEDAVWRDTRDGELVFGVRLEIDEESPGVFAAAELNDLFRGNFAGRTTFVGYQPVTGNDLRLISAKRAAESGVDFDLNDPIETAKADEVEELLEVELDGLDVVGLQSDINGNEGNPFSAWFLIKTNAPGFALADDAIFLLQAGEEAFEEPLLVEFDGFTPVPIPAALSLLASALGFLGLVMRGKS